MRRVVLILLFINSLLSAQNSSKEITYGAMVGANYSKMGGIGEALIPTGVYEGYEVKEKANVGVNVGLFFNWKYPYEKISIQPELYYSKQTTDFEYRDIKDFNYNVSFSYDNLNAGFLFKYYFTDRLYIGAGPYFTFNLDKDALTYSSNGEDLAKESGAYFEPDVVVQRSLKQAFEGKDYFHAVFALGYEFENRFNIGVRYGLGLSDALETESNGFRFKNTDNKVNTISIHIGYRFEFDGYNNF